MILDGESEYNIFLNHIIDKNSTKYLKHIIFSNTRPRMGGPYMYLKAKFSFGTKGFSDKFRLLKFKRT